MIRKSFKIGVMAALLSFSFSSCSLDVPLENEIESSKAITDYTSAKKALYNAYKTMPYHSSHCTLLFSELSDDFVTNKYTASNTFRSDEYNWKISRIKEASDNLWEGAYSSIVHVNEFLRNAAEYLKSHNDSGVEDLVEQAKVIKAYNYLYLIKIYAPSPSIGKLSNQKGIVLKDNPELEYLNRANLQQSFDAIKSTLNFIEKGQVYDKSRDKLLASRNLGIYILAESALWEGQYQEAIDWAEPLLNSYPREAFSKNSLASLWDYKNDSDTEIIFKYDQFNSSTSKGSSSIPTYFYRDYASDNLEPYFDLNPNISYSDGDSRKEIYAIENKNYTSALGKYFRNIKNKERVLYVNQYRAAGLAFIVAEAYARLGNRVKAIEIVNRFLSYRGADEMTVDGDLVSAILVEKQKEYVGEGESFFDLKRTHSRSLSDRSISSTDYRWNFPIPNTTLIPMKNPDDQNEGWSTFSN